MVTSSSTEEPATKGSRRERSLVSSCKITMSGANEATTGRSYCSVLATVLHPTPCHLNAATFTLVTRRPYWIWRMYFRHQVEAMRVQFLWFAANHAKQDHCSVLLCSNNRSKGKWGITFHRFPVDKYAKENWIVRIRRYILAKTSGWWLWFTTSSYANFIWNQFVKVYKVIWSTRLICWAELLFYYVPYVLLLPVINRYNCALDFVKRKGLLGTF